MLRAQQISLRLGSKTILKQVDFQAEAGQITVLLGRNGSGKTSLLRCLAMTQTRWQGQVTLDGCPHADELRPSALSGLGRTAERCG